MPLLPNRQISTQRKARHRLGTILFGIGLVLFLSTFLSAAWNFGNFEGFESRTRSMAIRSVVGMMLMMAGGGLIMVGVAGTAGSMLTLDPEQARKDLEPWARMSGGLTKDSLNEMGVDIPTIASALTGGLAAGIKPAAAAGESLEQRLRSLHALYKDGILSEEEYRREKQELLDEK